MLVDDSAIIRGLYRRMLVDNPAVEIVTDAGNGEQAVRRLEENLSVEVIILDIEMPIMDGLTAIPLLLKTKPNVMILMSSTLTAQNADTSLRAIQAGAADYLQKPTTNSELTSGQDFRSELLMRIEALGTAARRKARQPPRQASTTSSPSPVAAGRPSATPFATVNKSGWNLSTSKGATLRSPGTLKPKVVAIGSSTGGPEALRDVIQSLSIDINLPVVITQHMPPMFTKILAERLDKSGVWTCREAENGDELKPGLALVAPGGHHMLIKKSNNKYVVELDDSPPENFCRPAVDPMFRSVTRAFGGAVLGVVLTGMGNDGTKGGKDIIDAGGTIIAQDEESSIVWGMPGAVTDAGLCSKLVPIKEIAKYITNFVIRSLR
ncbi:MAG: chemotaxis response regulator protein-glutamate methylesterase [Rhodospirillales bacterium]|nr:chemotaxis response regulator protein-glutamate methylesterase [Rhodospirillales bacterium]